MNSLIDKIKLLELKAKLHAREPSMAETRVGTGEGLARLVGWFELLISLFRQVSFKGFVITCMLLLLIVLSAVGVVYSSHLSRQLFAEQAILLEKNDQLQLEWAQLLLEQSAWSSPSRIEGVAHQELNMSIPETEDIQLIY